MHTLHLKQFNWKKATSLTLGFILVAVLGLWAWNTLSELYGGPVAQYKHVVAALILLFLVRWPSLRTTTT
jgi:hypothetical protein